MPRKDTRWQFAPGSLFFRRLVGTHNPMHRKRLAIAALICALAGSAAGAELSGMGANIFGNYFNFAKANLPQAPVSSIDVGGMSVKLQSTRLVDIQKRFGGTLQSDGGAATW